MANTTGKERAISRTPGATRTGGLGSLDASATVAVKDIGRARDFYEGTLGLPVIAAEGDEVVVYQTGKSALMIYVSQFAGTNRATAVTWVTGDDLESLVQGLRHKGVQFEHYDLPGMTVSGDIHESGDVRAAWFKDPDGNIIALVNG